MFFVKMTLGDYWRQLLLNICEPIYKLIVYLYELFEVIGTAEIITNETLTVLYNRIGLLLGLYMIFRILFSFIQMLINPDFISDKEKGIGKITSKAILTIILIAITPFIFEKAIELQNFIVGVNGEKNVIASIILPDQDLSKFDDFGPKLSAYLFDSFYNYDDAIKDNPPKKCDVLEEYSPGVTMLHESIVRSKGSVSFAEHCLYKDDGFVFTDEFTEKERYLISFTWNGVFAIIVGGIVCFMLLTYVLSVGARVIQLAFLRIISPMAIMTFLSPKKDGMFNKWLKMCMTTYLDLFIRMAIIYFVVFLIRTIMNSDSGIALAKPFDDMWIVNIVMILALLIFAKKAPELLKELFPSSGSASLGFGLKSPKKMLDSMLGGKQLWNATKRTAGFGVGALAGGAIGFLGGRGAGRVSGIFGGMTRGALGGAKKGALWSNLKGVGTKQAQINKQKIDWKNNGSTWSGRMGQRMANTFGLVGAAEGFENQMAEYDKQLNTLNAKSSAYKEASGSVGKMEDRATSQLDTKTFKAEQIYQRNLQQRRRNYKGISDAMANGDFATAQSLIASEKARINKVKSDWDLRKDEYKDTSDKLKALESSGITSGAEYEATKDKFNKLSSYKSAFDVSDNELAKIEQISSSMDNEVKISKANEQKDKAVVRRNELKAKLDSSGTLTADEANEIKRLNEYIIKVDSETSELSKKGRYNVAQASADMTDVFTETRNEYITQSLQDEAGDVVIKSEYNHIQDVVSHPDNVEAFSGFTNSSVGNTYKAMDDFASEAKGASTALSSDIYRAQTAKDTISKSEAKKAADANRNAVGGHSGGKK